MVFPYFHFSLQDLLKLKSLNLAKNLTRLTPDDHVLLWDFTNERGTSAYDALTTKGILIYSGDNDIKKYSENQYRNIKYQIRRLRELKLIEEAIKEPNVHKARYYKLSEHGVYYLISNDKSLPYVILRSLLRNYRSHPLFQYFLYPCIKDATLLKIADDQSIFSHISLYLHD